MLTIKDAILKLKKGIPIVVPTETVYGLASSIFNEECIKKIFKIKKRPFSNPFIVHIGSIDQLNKITKNINNKAWKLINYFFPGPLTIVLEKKNCISNLITSGSNKVAVRMPNHNITLKLIKKLGIPIVASSANLYNKLSPLSIKEVQKNLPQIKNLIINGGNCSIGVESTIVEFDSKENIKLLRNGAISINRIEEILKKK